MLPHVIMHVGISVDGRIDWGMRPGNPYYDLIRRFNADLDISGTGTMLAAVVPDDPQAVFGDIYDEWANLPARPLLAIVDSRGQIRNWELLKKQPWWRGHLALVSESTPKEYLAYLTDIQIEYIMAGQDKVDLRGALEQAYASYGVRVVRTDCGGILNGVLLRGGLVNELSVVVNPSLVGGSTPRTMFVAPDLTSEEGVLGLRLLSVERMNGEFVWLRYEVCRTPAAV